MTFCFGAGDGNRTHATSLGSWGTTIRQHLHLNCFDIIPSILSLFKGKKKKIRRPDPAAGPAAKARVLGLGLYLKRPILHDCPAGIIPLFLRAGSTRVKKAAMTATSMGSITVFLKRLVVT